MARYIDADTLIAHLKDEIEGCKPPFCGRANGKSIAYGTILGLKSAISFAETLSTADVVPKSEVERLTVELEAMRGAANSYKMHYENLAREIFAEIEVEITAALKSNYKAKTERLANPRVEFVSYCDGKISALRGIEGFVEELKKKYTEGNR